MWYDDRRDGLVDDFVDAVSAQIELICRMPARLVILSAAKNLKGSGRFFAALRMTLTPRSASESRIAI
jgi:hypothetical protein